mmetsp:Transcript_8874/g.7852  ORF Transcript_8874/g.7852 Transcript_8874/m.7852 type:complete len:172 (-) Transcript_8874:240-755(-)
MFKLNLKSVNGDILNKKKDILESLFNKNFDARETASTDSGKIDYSPERRSLGSQQSRGPWGSPNRAQNIYQAAKNSISGNLRSNSTSLINLKNIQKNLSNYEDLDSTPYSCKGLSRMGYRETKPSKPILKGIKATRYNPKEDRTLNLRNKLIRKKNIQKFTMKKKSEIIQK